MHGVHNIGDITCCGKGSRTSRVTSLYYGVVQLLNF